MGALNYMQDRNGRAYCHTDFGTYHASYNNFPIYSDIGSTHGEQNQGTTVYWSRHNDEVLYRGFDVNQAFAEMEEHYQAQIAGSLGACVLRAAEAFV